jgi:hypothetical protein
MSPSRGGVLYDQLVTITLPFLLGSLFAKLRATRLFMARANGRAQNRRIDAPREIKVRHIGNCAKADPAYGEEVARAMGIPMSEVRKTPEAVPALA